MKTKRSGIRPVTGLAAVVAAIALAACGSSSSTNSTSSPSSAASSGASTGTTSASAQTGTAAAGTSTAAASGGVSQAQSLAAKAAAAPTKIPQTTPLPKKPPAGKLIIYIDNELAASVEIEKAEAAAAKAVGWSFQNIAYDAANPATLVAGLQTALQKKPAAVVVTGSPPSTYGASTIQAYAKAGVPIVVGAVYPFTPTSTLIGDPNSGASEEAGGKAVADWFIADSSGKGKAVLATVTAYPIYNAFNKGFEDEVKSLCSGCTYKAFDISAAEVNSNQSVRLAVSQMRTNPGYKYLFFDNGEYADGIGPALSTAGLSGIKVGGRSIDQNGAAYLKSNGGAWTGTNYNWLGYSLVDVALRHVEGAPIPAEDNDALSQLITSSNVGSITLPYVTPTDALDQFKKLWHVG